jgi:hypothetical protein
LFENIFPSNSLKIASSGSTYSFANRAAITEISGRVSADLSKAHFREQAMIVVNMPGDAVQVVDEGDLLWLRKAFDSEWKGATDFSAPDANKLRLVVSAKRVRQVIESDPVIYHEKAKSVLVFPGKLQLAVREAPDEARQKLESAKTKLLSTVSSQN